MTTATDPTPTVKTEPPVVEDPKNPETGKSYKEELAEERRKRQDAETRLQAMPKPAPPVPPEVRGDAWAQGEWNRLLAEDPSGYKAAKFIASLAGEFHAQRTLQSVREAQRVLKTTKVTLRGKFKDFGKYEAALDEELDQFDGPITTEGIEKVFHALRGQDLERLLEEERQKSRTTLETPTVVTPVRGTETPGPTGEQPLTPEQTAEAANFESEAVYRKHLKARQDQLKTRHGDQLVKLPTTLAERPTLKTP